MSSHMDRGDAMEYRRPRDSVYTEPRVEIWPRYPVRFAACSMGWLAASVCCLPRRSRLWPCFIKWRLRAAAWKVHN